MPVQLTRVTRPVTKLRESPVDIAAMSTLSRAIAARPRVNEMEEYTAMSIENGMARYLTGYHRATLGSVG